MGAIRVTKLECSVGTIVVVILLTVYKCFGAATTVFEDLFNGPTLVFVTSLVPELFTRLLENPQHEQTIIMLL